jgi:hypothetical protein
MAGVGSISSGLTGVLPVANGGTGNSTTYISGAIPYSNGTSLVSDTSKIFFNSTTNRLGINTSNPQASFEIQNGNGAIFEVEYTGAVGGKGVQFIDSDDNQSSINFVSGSGFDDFFIPQIQVIRSANQLNSHGIGVYYSAQVNDYIDSLRATGGGITYVVTKNDGSTIVTEMNLFMVRNGANQRFVITHDGKVGLFTQAPTARLHIPAGTATASTAPLKFTSQGASLLNPVEGGAVEFNGTNLLFTPSTTRHTVNHGLTGSATLDFLSTNAQNSRDMTIAVTGAALSDVVSLGVPNSAVNANTSYSAWVSAANTVTVRFNNYSSGTVDPASGTFKVFVTK